MCLPIVAGNTGLPSGKRHPPFASCLTWPCFVHLVSFLCVVWALEKFRFRQHNQDWERTHRFYGYFPGGKSAALYPWTSVSSPCRCPMQCTMVCFFWQPCDLYRVWPWFLCFWFPFWPRWEAPSPYIEPCERRLCQMHTVCVHSDDLAFPPVKSLR